MAYRSDRDALETRKDAAQKALAEVRGQLAQTQELAEKEAKLRAELDDIEKRLNDPGAARKLPMLDAVSVASPCEAKWSDMQGDDQARFCGQCEKHVYNLSAMERAEAEALILSKEGKLCIRYFRRADGTVLTADCPVGVRRRKRRRAIAAIVGGSAVVVAAMASMMWFGRTRTNASCAHGDTSRPQGGAAPTQPVSGGMAAPLPQTTMGDDPRAVQPPPMEPRATLGEAPAVQQQIEGQMAPVPTHTPQPRQTRPAMRPRTR